MSSIITECPQFFTATNLEWKPLLQRKEHKDIIIEGMRFMVKANRAKIFSFVIMPNHFHLIWQILPGYDQFKAQRDLLRHSAQRMKLNMELNYPLELEKFRVIAKDRTYQLWERNPMSVEIRTERFLLLKLNYIHTNPVRAGICQLPEEYLYSSARYYETGIDNWGFLSHYLG
jgi:REP element-mobilizing transposase RayT